MAKMLLLLDDPVLQTGCGARYTPPPGEAGA
jgi:hypothetical protein